MTQIATTAISNVLFIYIFNFIQNANLIGVVTGRLTGVVTGPLTGVTQTGVPAGPLTRPLIGAHKIVHKKLLLQ